MSLPRCSIALLALVVAVALAFRSTPEVRGDPPEAESRTKAAPGPTLVEVRVIELQTESPDGIDLRLGHLVADPERATGLLAPASGTGKDRRFGSVVALDPDACINELRKHGELRVVSRARLLADGRSGARYTARKRVAVRTSELRGETEFEKVRFETVGTEVTIGGAPRDAVQYEVELSFIAHRSEVDGIPLIAQRKWSGVATIPLGHTAVLSSLVRVEDWEGEPADVDFHRRDDDGDDDDDEERERAAHRAYAHLRIVLLTRTQLR